MEAVVLRNVCKSINGKMILDHINLTVNKGQFCALVGENGSGKTMILRAIAGILRVDEGEVEVFGEKVRIGKPPRSIGLTIENMNFWPYMTGVDILRSLAKIKKTASDKEIKEALVLVGLDPEDKRKFGKYSLGMKKRLAIAQAIMEKPALLLLDEPSSALDEGGDRKLNEIYRAVIKRGGTIIIASHDKEEVNEFPDTILEVQKGKLWRQINEK